MQYPGNEEDEQELQGGGGVGNWDTKHSGLLCVDGYYQTNRAAFVPLRPLGREVRQQHLQLQNVYCGLTTESSSMAWKGAS